METFRQSALAQAGIGPLSSTISLQPPLTLIAEKGMKNTKLDYNTKRILLPAQLFFRSLSLRRVTATSSFREVSSKNSTSEAFMDFHFS